MAYEDNPFPNSMSFADKEAAQQQLEEARRAALKGVAKQMYSDWSQYQGQPGYQRFQSPMQELAAQRVSAPMQAAGAYSQSAGIGGPVGPAFPGMAELPALQAKVQGFTEYMNMLSGPMAQQLAMLDEESLQNWYNTLGEIQRGSS